MSSSKGRALSRKIKPFFSNRVKEGPPPTLVDEASAYLSRTEAIVRWKSDVSAFNRTTTHRTVALKFVDKFTQPEK